LKDHISLRQANEDDFEFVFQLNKANFKDYVDQIRGWDDQIEKDDLRRTFRPGEDFIIVSNNEPIGILAIDLKPGYIYVRHIEILQSHKRKGIGRHIFDQLRDRRLPIMLQVTNANEPAYRFYRNLGFEIVEETSVKKLGLNGEIEIIKVQMRLPVDQG
jgi:ribosomal protein S18 acetylase RimI-like enzyme